jgi:penicillin-binding protein 1A
MRRGLYESRNIVAIKVGMELGEQSVIDMARKFGLTTPIPPYPSINIGAADVYPIELIAAYSAFASLGTRTTATSIVRVENAKGDVLWEPQVNRVPVMSPDEAWIMVSMMKDVVRRGTAAGSVGSQFPYPAGGKTGTTNDGADVWFIGYTADLVAGVWMGLDKPQKIKGNAQGGQLAAPAWTAFMREVYRRKPAPPDWPRPDGIVMRQIDPNSGLLAGPGCASYTEYFVAGTDPIQSCAPVISPYGVPGAPGATVDTAFGFPPIGSPPPRSAPPATSYPDTMRRPYDTGSFRAPTGTPGSVVVPGTTPAMRPSRPIRNPRDSVRPLPFDSIRIPRDSVRPTRETTNPFKIPPA